MAASIDFAVTETPQALEDVVALVDGGCYTVSNDSDVIVLYRIAVDAPAFGARGHPLPPYRDIEVVNMSAAEKSWVWTRDPPSTLVITETAP